MEVPSSRSCANTADRRTDRQRDEFDEGNVCFLRLW